MISNGLQKDAGSSLNLQQYNKPWCSEDESFSKTICAWAWCVVCKVMCYVHVSCETWILYRAPARSAVLIVQGCNQLVPSVPHCQAQPEMSTSFTVTGSRCDAMLLPVLENMLGCVSGTALQRLVLVVLVTGQALPGRSTSSTVNGSSGTVQGNSILSLTSAVKVWHSSGSG